MKPPTWPECGLDLRTVPERPIRGAGEHRRWDSLVAAHNWPPFAGLIGHGLRDVPTLDAA